MSEYRFHNEDGQHLHTLDDVPLHGTSSVCKVIGNANPLMWWASGKALERLGWLNKTKSTSIQRLAAAADGLRLISGLDAKGWAKALQGCYTAHRDFTKERASEGTCMHEALENYVKLCITFSHGSPTVTFADDEEISQVTRFRKWAEKEVSQFLWAEGHCYSERLWTGGIADCGARLKKSTGDVMIIDFKSSDTAWPNYFVQLGGYATAIEENGIFTADGRCIHTPQSISSLAVFAFGGDSIDPTIDNDVGKWKKAFKAALTLHRILTK